jgi:hypothetical protein
MPDNRPIDFPVPMDLPLFTAKDVGEVLGIASRRVVLLVEQGVVMPRGHSTGRGSARKHSFQGLFLISLADALGEQLHIAPRFLAQLTYMMSSIQSEAILDGDLPNGLQSVTLSEVLASYASGDMDLPGFLLLPSTQMNILTSAKDESGTALPNPSPAKTMWWSTWTYAYSLPEQSTYIICLNVNYRMIARSLLRRTATFLNRNQ